MNYRSFAGAGIIMVIIIGILALLVAVALFFLFRAITCWYFKINKLLKEQQKTNSYLERIAIAVEHNNTMASLRNSTPAIQPVSVSRPAPAVANVAPAPSVAQTIPVPQPAPAVHSEPLQEQPEITVTSEPAEKVCAGCGVVLPADASFCTQCGTPAGI